MHEAARNGIPDDRKRGVIWRKELYYRTEAEAARLMS